MARFFVLLWLLLMAAGNAAALGSDEPAIVLAQLDTESRARTATLQLHSRTVFVFRADFAGYTPEERATGAARRIDAQIKAGGSGEIGSSATPQGNQILLDGERVLLITPGDVNLLEAETLDSLTDETIANLKVAVAEVYELRDLETVLKSLGYLLLATLIYGLTLHLLVRYTVRLRVWLADQLGTHVEKLKIAGIPAIEPARFRKGAEGTVTLFFWALSLVATYSWVTFGMLQFPYTRGWGERLKDFLLEMTGDLVSSMLGAIPGLVTVLAIVIIARFINHLAKMFFDRVERGWVYVRWVDKDTARPTRRIATVVIWLFALAMAYPYLPGAQTNAFKGLSVLLGLMVSIGASSVVAQAASGLILMYSRAFRAGEYVRVGDDEGTVRELGMFATRLATVSGEELILPNSHILGHTTHNLSRMSSGGYAIDTTVTIGYDTPWRQVHAILQEASNRTTPIRKSPAPYVIQTALSDFYVEYRLVARADTGQPRPTVLSELHANILDVFNEHGVQIMSPHYFADPGASKLVPRVPWSPATTIPEKAA